MVQGKGYEITDIGIRMLESHELFAAWEFSKDYIINNDFTGKAYPKTQQVARYSNTVSLPFAKALVEANLSELYKKNKLS